MLTGVKQSYVVLNSHMYCLNFIFIEGKRLEKEKELKEREHNFQILNQVSISQTILSV